MPETYWLIRGYDSSTLIFERKVKTAYFTDEQMQCLLKAVTARTLTDDEIVGAYARRRSRIANDHLIVQRDAQQNLTCGGSGTHFIARLLQES